MKFGLAHATFFILLPVLTLTGYETKKTQNHRGLATSLGFINEFAVKAAQDLEQQNTAKKVASSIVEGAVKAAKDAVAQAATTASAPNTNASASVKAKEEDKKVEGEESKESSSKIKKIEVAKIIKKIEQKKSRSERNEEIIASVDQELWAISQIKGMQAMQSQLLSMIQTQMNFQNQLNMTLMQQNFELQRKMQDMQAQQMKNTTSPQDIAKMFKLGSLIPEAPLNFQNNINRSEVQDQSRGSASDRGNRFNFQNVTPKAKQNNQENQSGSRTQWI